MSIDTFHEALSSPPPSPARCRFCAFFEDLPDGQTIRQAVELAHEDAEVKVAVWHAFKKAFSPSQELKHGSFRNHFRSGHHL